MDQSGKIPKSLRERPEWLSARDLMEVFGIGRTRANEVVNDFPHIYVGTREKRIHQRTVGDFLRVHHRLPYKGELHG